MLGKVKETFTWSFQTSSDHVLSVREAFLLPNKKFCYSKTTFCSAEAEVIQITLSTLKKVTHSFMRK